MGSCVSDAWSDICGYYVMVDEMDRNGSAHAGLKWLAARRPEVYREQKNLKHTLNMDQAFLRFLDQMDERAKLERAQNAPLIEHMPSTDVKSAAQRLEMPEIQEVTVGEQPDR
jgi:hypothetical protein